MSSAGSSILTPRPAGWPAAAVHSTAACRVRRLFSGRENPEPTQGGMRWSLGSSRRTRHSASDPGTVAMDVRASPPPKQGTDEATGSRSAPAHCGHAPGSRSGLWTRAERSPDLRARQRSEGSRPGGGGGGVGWLRVRGPLHSRRGSRGTHCRARCSPSKQYTTAFLPFR